MDRKQVIDCVKAHINNLNIENLMAVFKMLYPQIEDEKYDTATGKIYYAISSEELLSWEEEVDQMTELDLAVNVQKLLSKTHLTLPGKYQGLTNYFKQLLKENK